MLYKVIRGTDWRYGLSMIGSSLLSVVYHGLFAAAVGLVAVTLCLGSPSIQAWLTAMVYGPPACQEQVFLAMQHPACHGVHPGRSALPHERR
jgi:hypothetical protein